MVHFIWLRLVCMIHPQRGVCSPTHRPRLIDWLIDWLIERLIDWEIERFMHITYGSNLSEFVFSSYNIRWLHHLNTSSVYIIPLRYRRSSLTAAVRPSFYTLKFACVERFTRNAGNAVQRTDRYWLIERFMHITYGSNLSEFMFQSYNILWLHHLNTSSVYIIPLRYRRSSLTAGGATFRFTPRCLNLFYSFDFNIPRDLIFTLPYIVSLFIG